MGSLQSKIAILKEPEKRNSFRLIERCGIRLFSPLAVFVNKKYKGIIMKKLIITLGLILGLATSLQARTLEEVVASCEAGNTKMCIALGNDFKKRNNPKKAQLYYAKGVGILEAGCNKNKPDACFALGGLYIRGSGVEESNAKAKELYEKSLNIYKKACANKDEHSCMMVDEMKMHIEML